MKIFTWACLLAGLLLMLGWPWLMGPAPREGAPRQQLLAYTVRSQYYIGGLVLCLVGAGVGSLLVVRQAKRQYAELSRQNMERLVDEFRQAKKQGTNGDDAPSNPR